MKLPMKSLILISVYLAKDILRRWIETPTAFLSRFMLCTCLSLLYVILSAVFLLAEMKIQRKIDSIGLATILLKTFEQSEQSGRPKVRNLFASLSESGVFVPFEHTFLMGKLSGGKTCRVIIFDDNALAGMMKLSKEFQEVRNSHFLASRGYPRAFREKISFQGFILDTEVISPPPIFEFLAKDSPLLMISDEYAKGLGKGMRNEGFIFIGNDYKQTNHFLKAIHTTLDAEMIKRYELSSPMEWVGEIANIREYRAKCQTFAGFSMGLLILLTFSSIAIFEFRQNLYVISLFKSFGVPVHFLFLRFLFDAMLIAYASCALAMQIGRYTHPLLFANMNLSVHSFEGDLINHFKLSENAQLMAILFSSVMISMFPVGWALRSPVGKNLS